MPAELLNPRDCLKFSSPFRSLMTACEKIGYAEQKGTEAFEIRQEHMLPWLERNGHETARSVVSELEGLVSGLKKRPRGTVWSDEFDFNHRWSAAKAASYFDTWRAELIGAARLYDAKSIVLLSLTVRARDEGLIGTDDLGEHCAVRITEREFAVLANGDAVRDGGRWVCVIEMHRTKNGPQIIIRWPSLVCGICGNEPEIGVDEDDTSNLWRARCCVGSTWGKTVARLALAWQRGEIADERTHPHV